MIRVTPAPAPATFDERCRLRGNRWLDENRQHPEDGSEAPAYWREFTPELRAAFHQRCAYLGMWIATGTVDHFKSRGGNRSLIYEWSNYRYADSGVNSGKKPAWDGKLLDPFEIEDAWFELLLPSCQLRIVTEAVPPELLERVRFTVEKLRLEHGESVVEQRRSWLECYESGDLLLEKLREKAPLVARAVERTNHPRTRR